jgi:hypothetical protein
MNDFARLLQAGDDFERALLDSARRDRGSERAKLRALATFGALGLNLAATTAAASPSAMAAVVSSGAASSVPVVTLGAMAKWLGVGVLAGTVSVGGSYAIRASSTTPASPAAVTVPDGVPAPNAAAPAARPAIRRDPPNAATSEARRAPPGPETPTVSEPVVPWQGPAASNGAFQLDAPESRLREELAALERTRRSLRGGHPGAALEELARYQARFPRGALSQEATLLAVEARLEAGDVKGARAIADRVLAVDGASPHARRLRALLSAKGIP